MLSLSIILREYVVDKKLLNKCSEKEKKISEKREKYWLFGKKLLQIGNRVRDEVGSGVGKLIAAAVAI